MLKKEYVCFYLSIVVASIAFALAIVSLLAGGGRVAAAEIDKGNIVAGALRSEDDRGWYIIDDKGHSPVNVKSVEVKSGAIVVNYSFKGKKINSFVAAPDESFALNGFIVGASVTNEKAEIYVSRIKNGRAVPVDAATIRSKRGNIWFYGLFET